MKTELKFEKIKKLVYPNLTVPVYSVVDETGYVPFIRHRDLPSDFMQAFMSRAMSHTVQFMDTNYYYDFEDFMRYSKSDVVAKYRLPVIHLTCSCCGGSTRGRTWHNRDSGFGLCQSCAVWIAGRETAEDMKKCYGTAGVHYNIPGETQS